jgi:hypothetical protein
MANRATSVIYGLALVSLAVLAAPSGCGGSNTGYNAFADSGPINAFDATQNTSSGNTSSGGSSSNGGGDDGSQQCMSGCTSDQDCQNSCPAAPNGGVNCCDVPSGMCFPMSSCPVADAGGTE